VAAYDPSEVKRIWSDTLAQAEDCDGNVVLYSQENLADFDGVDPGLVANRLSALEPDARIIFVIRNQPAFLASLYSHLLATDKTKLSLRDWIDEQRRSRRINSWLSFADFNQTISHYDRLFGRENVHVFFVEDLRRNSSDFIRDLCNTLGVDPDVGVAVSKERDRLAGEKKVRKMRRPSKWALLAKGNRTAAFLDAALRPLVPQYILSLIGKTTGLAGGANVSLPKWADDLFHDLYSPGNAALADRLNRDLSSIGFPL